MRCALVWLMLTSVAVAQPRDWDKIPVGKDTTILDGPLTAAGYVDYADVLNRQNSAGIRPEENAMALLVQAFGPKPNRRDVPDEFFKRLGVPVPPANEQCFVGYFDFTRKHYRGLIDDDISFAQPETAKRRPWTAKEFPFLDRYVSAQEAALTVIARAVQRPRHFQPIVASNAKGGQPVAVGVGTEYQFAMREAMGVLLMRAMQRLSERQIDDSWADLMTGYRLALQCDRCPSMMQTLACYAGVITVSEAMLMFLSEAGLNERQLRRCEADLRTLPPAPSVAHHFESSGRFEILSMLQGLNVIGMIDFLVGPDDKDFLGNFFSILGKGIARSFDTELDRQLARESINWGLVFRDHVQASRRMSECLAIGDPRKRGAELSRIADDYRAQFKQTYPFTAFLDNYLWWLPIGWIRDCRSKGLSLHWLDVNASGYTRIAATETRCRQVELNLRGAIALAKFKLGSNQYPEKLDELVPRYLNAVPTDLFAGNPLIYRRTSDGYLLYGVGNNGKDDGGKTNGDAIGADDIRVRMPMPKKRRY